MCALSWTDRRVYIHLSSNVPQCSCHVLCHNAAIVLGTVYSTPFKGNDFFHNRTSPPTCRILSRAFCTLHLRSIGPVWKQASMSVRLSIDVLTILPLHMRFLTQGSCLRSGYSYTSNAFRQSTIPLTSELLVLRSGHFLLFRLDFPLVSPLQGLLSRTFEPSCHRWTWICMSSHRETHAAPHRHG